MQDIQLDFFEPKFIKRDLGFVVDLSIACEKIRSIKTNKQTEIVATYNQYGYLWKQTWCFPKGTVGKSSQNGYMCTCVPLEKLKNES